LQLADSNLDSQKRDAHQARPEQVEAQEKKRAAENLYADADLSASANQPVKPQDGNSCPSSVPYLKLVNRALENFYDPSRLTATQVQEIKSKYNCSIKSDADAVKYADEALKTLQDDYTDVITKPETVEILRSENGEISGIGIELKDNSPKKDPAAATDIATDKTSDKAVDKAVEPNQIVINKVVENSPALAGGLKAGDRIVKVDNEPIDTETATDTAKLIRGEVGTKVKLTVERQGKEEVVEMTRALIDFPAVKSEMRDGYLHLSVQTFGQSDTSDEVKAAIQGHPDAKGYILDLRNNPGGFVMEALKTGSLFMTKGEMLRTRTRAADPDAVDFETTNYTLNDKGIQLSSKYDSDPQGKPFEGALMQRHPDLVDKPVVILVNENSASASELLTGAMKDNKEAYVIGNQTYGKGIGQITFRNGLPDGSWLKVTNFQYFTPNGTWPGDAHNRKYGIAPDLKVTLPKDVQMNSPEDIQLKAALDYLKSKETK
jgi:carboxyl-terminal processing protease